MKHKVCDLDAVPAGGFVRVELDGEPILLLNVAGEIYAVSDTCSHAEASLSEGDLDGYEISCPMHGAYFDVRTGEALSPPATHPIRTYPVIVEDDSVYVELPESS